LMYSVVSSWDKRTRWLLQTRHATVGECWNRPSLFASPKEQKHDKRGLSETKRKSKENRARWYIKLRMKVGGERETPRVGQLFRLEQI
jgi:hypothetical protein